MAGVLPTLAAGFGVVAGASAAQPQSLPETVGPVLELPQFTVHGRADIPESDAWLYGSLPGFEVLSTASDRRTRRLLQEFRLFDEGLRVVWPIPRAVPARPVLLIVCGRGADFARFEAGTKPPPRGTGRATRWLQGGAQTAFVVDVATQSLDLAMPNVAMESALTGGTRRSPTGEDEEEEGTTALGDSFAEEGLSVDGGQQLCREYVRYLLSRNEPRMPPWLEEGLAQIFMGMKVTPRTITFARLTPSSQVPVDVEGDFNAALRNRSLLSLGDFFAVARTSPLAEHAIGSAWAKQAQAFVHLGLYGRKGRFRPAFLQLVERASRAPVTEAVFRECFGFGFKRMEMELREHVELPQFDYFKFSLKSGSELGGEAIGPLRDATPDEVGRMLGDALALADERTAALRELRLAYARGAREARFLAALGNAELAGGSASRGRELLEKAVAARVDRSEAHVALVQARLAEITGELDAAHTAALLRVLFDARRDASPSAAVYRLMGVVWTHSQVTAAPANLEVLYEGLAQFPGDADLACSLAGLEIRLGHQGEARKLVAVGLRTVADENLRARLLGLEMLLGK